MRAGLRAYVDAFVRVIVCMVARVAWMRSRTCLNVQLCALRGCLLEWLRAGVVACVVSFAHVRSFKHD